MSNIATKIEGTEEAWETGKLGADDAHVKVAPDEEQQLDAALDLHPISIRLQKSLLENLKAIALLNGIGYQPLVRQVLTRFVDCELKNMLASRVAEKRLDQVSHAPKLSALTRTEGKQVKASEKTRKAA